MKCNCGKEMVLTDTYKRGRKEYGVYKCVCGESKIIKLRQVPNKPGRGW